MKVGWGLKTLGDIGKVSMCKRILKKQTLPNGDIPFFKIGTFGKMPNAFISNELYEEYLSKYSFPKKGDILLSASGTIGRRVIYNGKPAYFQDSNIVWIDNDEEKVLNEYLYKFYGFCDWNPSRGATISRLYNNDLRRIKIPIPPLSEQKQIVAILDQAFAAIDRAKANIEKNIQNAKELFQSKLNEVFSQKGAGWEEKRLGDVAGLKGRIGWRGLTAKEYVESGPLFLSVHSLNYGDFVDFRDAFHITNERYEESPEIMLQKGDVLICKDGAGIGKLGMLRELPDKATVNSSLLVSQM